MNEIVYEIPDGFKNFVIGFYLFGWLFQGQIFISMNDPKNCFKIISDI